MSVDWGERRVGVAIGDDEGISVRPLEVIGRRSDSQVMDELARIVTGREISRIVVGAPYNMDGSRGPAFERVLKVALTMEGRLRRPVLMLDERLTSSAAEAVSGRKPGGALDDVAAAILLESFFRDPAKAVKPQQIGRRPD
ncbi:MAG: Holliday junction resolvase RuvX [Deltaproteobacteria bacterium]|nr:Holliday junction resolvase RuvX [Deltaproteobacteria bacterium]